MFYMKHYFLKYAKMFYMKLNTSQKGSFGEDLALSYLKRHSYKLLDRNFRSKHGEIDLIMEKSGKISFFEVKSVSRETFSSKVIRETFDPADNMHEKKLKNLVQAINHYISLHNLKPDDFKLFLITVEYSKKDRKARFKLYPII